MEPCYKTLFASLCGLLMLGCNSGGGTSVGASDTNGSSVTVPDTAAANPVAGSSETEGLSPTDNETPPVTELVNRAPVLRGMPRTWLLPGERFSFTPEATDADGDVLAFTIENAPAWLSFDASTGALSGTGPPDGVSNEIRLSVTDGESVTTLDPFSLSTVAAYEIGAAYGVATMGSIYSSAYAAELAIDGELSTFQHTRCTAGRDWWQLELPRSARVTHIEISSRQDEVNADRLMDARVTLSAGDRADGTIADEDTIGTLEGSTKLQTILFDAPRESRYLVIESATPGTCLHVAEVRVFGDVPQAPTFASQFAEVWIDASSLTGDAVAVVAATDLQNDELNYRLNTVGINTGTVPPLQIEQDGTLRLTSNLDPDRQREWHFDVIVTDGQDTTRTAVHARLGAGRGVVQERWFGISPVNIIGLESHADYPETPFDTTVVSGFQHGPQANTYGKRLSSVLVPEDTGNYEFALAADDIAELRLSGAGVAGRPFPVLEQATSTSEGDWTSARVSMAIALEAGQAYGVEVLQVNSGYADHVALGWRKVGDTAFRHVPESLLYVDALSAGVVAPAIATQRTIPLIAAGMAVGEVVTILDGRDPQGDALDWRISSDVPFSIDAQGQVTVSSPLVGGTRYTFDVTAGDGTYVASTTVSIDTTADSAIEDALASGDASAVTTPELIDALRNTVAGESSAREQLHGALFGGIEGVRALGPIDWNPTHDSVQFDVIAPGGNMPFLISNDGVAESSLGVTLGVAGDNGGTSRHIALANNMLAGIADGKDWTNDAANELARRSVGWLLRSNPAALADVPKRVVVAHMADSYYFRHDAATNAWFEESFPGFVLNDPDTCESTALAGCLVNADLMVLSGQAGPDASANDDDHGIHFDESAVMAAVRSARERGVPLLYLQYDGDQTPMGKAMMSHLGLSTHDNYWAKERLSAWTSDALNAVPSYSEQFADAVDSINEGRIAVDYTEDEVCTNYVGRITCKPDLIENGFGGSLQTSIVDALDAMRASFAALDAQGQDVFTQGSSWRAIKLAALLGDHWRADIRYPMDKFTTDAGAFWQAVYGDMAINYARANTPAQPDMGAFASKQASLATASTSTRMLQLTPDPVSGWTSTGLYVPPGRTVRIQRLDTTGTTLRARVNFVRHTTRHWNPDGYSRPLYLASRELRVDSNQATVLSTPHGGPLYLWLDGVEGLAAPISLEVSGVLDNPLLDQFDSTSVANFSRGTEATDSDWIDIKTPFAEIHSLKSRMLTAFARQDGDAADGYDEDDVAAYAEDVNRYMISGNYEFAGFSGDGLASLDASTAAWCTSAGLDTTTYRDTSTNLCTDELIHAKPRRQHVNSDVDATCGGLCAGNPFDSAYPIMPLDWGENHEMGHNLQRSRLKTHGGRSNEVSNNIFPIHVKWQWARDQGLEAHPSARRGDHSNAFAQLRAAILDGDSADINHRIWVGSGTYDNNGVRLAFHEQLAFTHGDWSMWTKLYVLERIFTNAIRDDDRWASVQAGIGFSNYTRSDASGINGNDFMLVAASMIEGRDYSDFFALWGVDTSEVARAQVVANGQSLKVPTLVYYVRDALDVAFPADEDLIDPAVAAEWADPTP